MAKKADNRPAATERVTFTSGAADRIAKAVRTVEAGDRDCGPLTFGARIGGVSGKIFRICTYTGAWSIGSSKTVTFKYQTATPNTVSATNLFFPLPSNEQRDCAIAKDGSAWYLLQVQWNEQAFVSSASLGTGSLTFTRHAGVSLGTASTVAITTITCA